MPNVVRGITWSGNANSKVQPLEEVFIAASKDTIECLNVMMTLDPKRRWSARRILEEHEYFKSEPKASRVEDLYIPGIK